MFRGMNARADGSRALPSHAAGRVRPFVMTLLVVGSIITMGQFWVAHGIIWWTPQSATPFDRTDSIDPEIWTFLNDARKVIPPGSRVRVVAEDPGDAMDLYMTAMTVLPDEDIYPTMYFGVFHPNSEQRLLLDYGCRGNLGGVVVSRLKDGCVRRR